MPAGAVRPSVNASPLVHHACRWLIVRRIAAPHSTRINATRGRHAGHANASIASVLKGPAEGRQRLVLCP